MPTGARRLGQRPRSNTRRDSSHWLVSSSARTCWHRQTIPTGHSSNLRFPSVSIISNSFHTILSFLSPPRSSNNFMTPSCGLYTPTCHSSNPLMPSFPGVYLNPHLRLPYSALQGSPSAYSANLSCDGFQDTWVKSSASSRAGMPFNAAARADRRGPMLSASGSVRNMS